jgi:ChpA-C
MHYLTKRRVALGMTTGGLLITGLGVSAAHADTSATGETSHSPGVGSGNLIQLPINAPINVCGNQLDVIGILDSVTGNSCENRGGGSTSASGHSNGSPGVGSGNLIQVPINAPVNVCGNQLDVIGLGNSDAGNSCENHGGGSTTASGSSNGSPGIIAGNVLQVPINAPVNVCGNQVDVIGILDSVTGNSCENNGHGRPPQPSPSPTPPPTPTPTPTGCGCPPPPPPPPPPTTPCPPSGTGTPTPASSSSPPAVPPPPPSTSHSGSSGGGSNGGGASGSSGGSSGKPTAVLAHTGSGALAAAPVGAGLIGGGLMLRKRIPRRSH